MSAVHIIERWLGVPMPASRGRWQPIRPAIEGTGQDRRLSIGSQRPSMLGNALAITAAMPQICADRFGNPDPRLGWGVNDPSG